jgi:enoyl-CoA hydratase
MADLVTRATTGHVAVLTLNRPAAHNALNAALIDELAAALEMADVDPQIRVVVLTGSDRAFCAGADITEITAITADELLDRKGFPRRLFGVLDGYRKPLIAAVRGPALGGGCEIALACDIVVAGESARFGLPEVSLGVIPGAGGTQRLVHAVGKSKAMRLLLTGEPIGAADACTAGLVAQVVADEDCLGTATELADRIARNAPLAVQLATDAALAAHQTVLSNGLAHERRNFFLLLNTDDMHEGVNAFLGKRRPNFTGH